MDDDLTPDDWEGSWCSLKPRFPDEFWEDLAAGLSE